MNVGYRSSYSDIAIGQFSAALLGSYLAGLPNYDSRCQQMTKAFAFFMFLPLTVICQGKVVYIYL